MNRLLLSLSLLSILALSGTVLAQEEQDTPSQRTREALEKFRKAPAAVGKALEGLKEAGKAKLQESFSPESQEKAEPDALTLPSKKAEPSAAPRYSPAGKRDPFQPLALRAKASRRPRENLTPLERYELGQLQLVGIVSDGKRYKALVEVMEADKVVRGYTLEVGTPIGPDEGKVKAITPTEVVIEESYIDFYGARKTREVRRKLVSE